MSTASALDPVDDLESLLVRRLRRAVSGSVVERKTATVVFDTGASQWTVDLQGESRRVSRGAAHRPTLVVHGTQEVLTDVISGRASGVHAFLEGKITVRGNLALALQLDGLFEDAAGDARPAGFPRARVVETMGIRTAYLEAGPADAPPLIMLHGLGATNASLLPCLADLATDYRVISPDLPGFGESAAPAGPYTPAWFAAWLESLQHDLGARQAVLLGNSLGGRIALEAGLTHPKSVKALCLLTPSPAFRRLRQLVPAVRLMRPELASFPLPLHHGLMVTGIRTMFSQPDRLPKPWYDAAADESIRVYRSRAHRVAFAAAARQIFLEEAHGHQGFWDRLPGLRPPALFVWGDRDRLVPASFARHVEGALPTARSVVLEDSGHVPQFEHPERTMALVREFLADVS